MKGSDSDIDLALQAQRHLLMAGEAVTRIAYAKDEGKFDLRSECFKEFCRHSMKADEIVEQLRDRYVIPRLD